MKINTTRFGEIDVKDEKIIFMPVGLLGFEHIKRYILLNHSKEGPFMWFQAIDDPSLAFILIDPLFFRPDYKIDISKEDIVEIGITDEKDVVILAIVTLRDDPQKMTANLQGPIIINAKTRLAMQIVLAEGQYTTRHDIIEEMKIYPAQHHPEEKEIVQHIRHNPPTTSLISQSIQK
ncbi:MAG: flagellar assembly protein FliW [Nitrospinae bacterium]|nr:flagellar assembly protein FliW [Nitrospinota bacterium]